MSANRSRLLTVDYNLCVVARRVQGFGPLGFFLGTSEALRDERCCFCCASSFGAVWPRWSGSCTFFVASLVLPSLLTATCVLLSSAMPTTLSRSGYTRVVSGLRSLWSYWR